ncbi:hypothetical protein HFO93_13595 [Rhizobium leguminosarum]|uniref:hypothetical protein n=1 Tax=Rhizobium leguminosarum TaxID=384 RepID=UPI001C9821FB|nr:hypothetical protein [Rhizobium leguminosarum]MBY5444501.1 hypothetical protein [Rhizobium leguminosarum]
MARPKTKKIGIFKFTNWPGEAAQPTLSEHSAFVVDHFVRLLEPASNARVVGLEVAADVITLVRRKRKPLVDERFVVAFDLHGSRTTEKSVALVCSDPTYRDYLREMVEAASGHTGFNTSVRSLIAGKVFTTSIGIFL